MFAPPAVLDGPPPFRPTAHRSHSSSRSGPQRGHVHPDAHAGWHGHGAGRGSVKARTIEGELVAKSVSETPSPFAVGDRVFHQKFGNGNVAGVEGNKLTIDFDKAGQKKVLDGFVTAI